MCKVFKNICLVQIFELPELQSLFNTDKYKQVTEGICGSDHPYSKRVQVNLIIMVPGQDLPMHYDLPWYRSKNLDACLSSKNNIQTLWTASTSVSRGQKSQISQNYITDVEICSRQVEASEMAHFASSENFSDIGHQTSSIYWMDTEISDL